MLTFELAADDLENNGQFVKIGSVALAIANAKGVSNLLDSERKIFHRINAGVQSGALNPIDPETLQPLPKSDFGNGIVPFEELDKWGRSTTLFAFERATDSLPELPANLGSKGGAVKVDACATVASEEPETKNWILLIQAEAARRWKLLRDAGANPTKNNIKDDLATWCRESRVLTDGDINPTAGYIYRHVLSKWTPPSG